MTDEQFHALVRQVQQVQDAQSEDHRQLNTLIARVEQLERNMKDAKKS